MRTSTSSTLQQQLNTASVTTVFMHAKTALTMGTAAMAAAIFSLRQSLPTTGSIARMASSSVVSAATMSQSGLASCSIHVMWRKRRTSQSTSRFVASFTTIILSPLSASLIFSTAVGSMATQKRAGSTASRKFMAISAWFTVAASST